MKSILRILILGLIINTQIICIAVHANAWVTKPGPLDSSNWDGTQGARYWEIWGDPGEYYLDIPGKMFSTTHNFAIKISSSNIVLDGRDTTITSARFESPPTFIKDDPDMYGVRVNAGVPSSGVQVKNLNVEKKHFGVIFEASSYGTIENVNASHNSRGIAIWNGDYNTINLNTASDNDHTGIVLDAHTTVNSHNVFSNNIANNNAQIGILLWLLCPNSRLTGNTTNGNGNAGIALSYEQQKEEDPIIYDANSTLTGNTSNSNPVGIWVNNSKGSVIIDNKLNGNTNVGLRLGSTISNTVKDNQATLNKIAGIWLTSSTDNDLINNTCDSNDGNGINLTTNSTNNELTQNSANDNKNMGIVLESGSDYNILTGNTANNSPNGMLVKQSNINEIIGNTVNNNTNVGLWLDSSDGNTVKDNQATLNKTAGIWLTSSTDNDLINNTCDSNDGNGINLTTNSTNNELTQNSANDNKNMGIVLESGSDYNILTGNTANNNPNGMLVKQSNINEIIGNTVNNNTNVGLWLDSSDGNIITDNQITNAQNAGIWLSSSSNNSVSGNTITDNRFWGIFHAGDSNNQRIYNNYFNNAGNAGFDGVNAGHLWNISQTSGVNIVGGPYLGGNFWGKPNETGFSQVTADSDDDGICDSEYTVSTGNVDALPLHEYSPPSVIYVNQDDATCGGNTPCLTTIQAAINFASLEVTINIAQGTYNETFLLNEAKELTIEGGWDPSYTNQTPNTTIISAPTITNGSMTFLNLRITP